MSRYITPFYVALLTMFFSTIMQAQLTQRVRGTVVESMLQFPVSNAIVVMQGIKDTVVTDSTGVFRFENVPVGLQTIRITHENYKEAQVANITVNAGKELVLTIPVELKAPKADDIIIKSNSKRNRPNNEMSTVSARAFTVEETQRYAASVNDPLRMATNFAGVVGADDGNNNIVIRGNSPAGLLWRMEGVDIPNPNHFSNAGSSGGGISILSSQLLANSDFITGAFAAEYGNAVGGVFDLKLRKGNNERKEFALQAGVLGLNVSAEGPFKKGYKGSYLVNYRYSTLAILNKAGILPNQSPTTFQDLSYHISLPTKKAGTFTLFGFGGLSAQDSKYLSDSAKWQNDFDRYGSTFTSNTGVSAITHLIKLNKNATLKSSVSYAKTETGSNAVYAKTTQNIQDNYKEAYSTNTLNLNTTLNYRINRKNILRTGFIVRNIAYNYFQKSREDNNAPLLEVLNTKGNTNTIQGFAQWQYKTNQFTFNTGVHYLQLLLNNNAAIEPRFSVKWDINPKQSLSLGYGLHSQTQALGVYFAKAQNTSGVSYSPNKNVGFTQSQHLVLSHSLALATHLKLKTEVYYQQLNNVPVSASDTNTFSTLNIIDDFVTEPLVNTGKGRNYGVEISLEKYLHNNFYFMFSNSFYQSKYTAKDGKERDTRFNGGYVSNLVMGKEYVSTNQRRTLGLNIKMVYAGGFRDTPIDLAKSTAQGSAYYIQDKAFTIQNAAYYRTDVRVSMKWNRKNRTSTLSLDLQNVSGRKNVYGNYYDPLKGNISTIYQNGLIPILNYKIEF